MTGCVIGVTLQVSALALAALLVTVALRRASAALRHWVLSVAIVCALCLPVLQAVVPAWGSGLVPAPDLASPVGHSAVAARSSSPLPGLLG